MIRCALHSFELSGSFGGYDIIVGGIFADLGLGTGQKSFKITLFGGMKCLESGLKIMCVHDARCNLRQERYTHNEVCVL